MSFKRIAVYMDASPEAEARLAVAAALAKRFEARLIGVAAGTIQPPPADPTMGDPEWLELQREQIREDSKTAEAKFRAAPGGAAGEWRSLFATPALAMTDIVVNLWSLGARPDGDQPLGIICEGFRCSDGYVVMQVVREHQFTKLADLIGKPEWHDDPRFADRYGWEPNLDEVIRPAVEAWSSARTRAEAADALAAVGIAAGPSQTAPEVIADDHVDRTSDHHQAGLASRCGGFMALPRRQLHHRETDMRPARALRRDLQHRAIGIRCMRLHQQRRRHCRPAPVASRRSVARPRSA